ncbi:exosome complex component RRP46 [Microplitis mediator]|uniref:exosome complex component RRP46 n=1 Tax=Microplitis mediator TaxID=375433 RepID=UPI0025529988|nr:exosome complex component RRP46 [Microplitis mediator]
MTSSECTLRAMNCEMNLLSMPDGSSMFMQGNTCIVAGVYGPIEAKLQKMLHDKASVEVVFTPLKGPPSIDGRMKELYIKETCESTLITSLHPGTSISINTQEMQDDGGLLACAINASCIALINSNLSMKFTIAAVNCMIDEDSKEIIVDPDEIQLQNAKATFMFAFDSVKKDIVCCNAMGRFNEKQLLEATDKCRDASKYIFDFYRDIVKKYAYAI